MNNGVNSGHGSVNNNEMGSNLMKIAPPPPQTQLGGKITRGPVAPTAPKEPTFFVPPKKDNFL